MWVDLSEKRSTVQSPPFWHPRRLTSWRRSSHCATGALGGAFLFSLDTITWGGQGGQGHLPCQCECSPAQSGD
eukprot:4206888-Amphidinium_carterae.1